MTTKLFVAAVLASLVAFTGHAAPTKARTFLCCCGGPEVCIAAGCCDGGECCETGFCCLFGGCCSGSCPLTTAAKTTPATTTVQSPKSGCTKPCCTGEPSK